MSKGIKKECCKDKENILFKSLGTDSAITYCKKCGHILKETQVR